MTPEGLAAHAKASVGAAAVVGFVATVVGANWAIEHFGLVPVGFGLEAPAGVYFAGIAFTMRDLAQASVGRVPVLAAIVAGAALSVAIAPRFALASGAAFLLSELADFAVYTPLSRRGMLRAVAASNAVGLVVDSVLFLWLAFGSLQFMAGQVLGKAWMTALGVAVVALLGRWRLSEPPVVTTASRPARGRSS